MASKNSKHRKNNSNNKSYFIIAFVIVLILIVIICLKKPKEIAHNEKTQVIINNENITESMEDNIINENNKIYMSIEDIQKFLDKTIYQEQETGLIITTSERKIATLKQDEDKIEINGSNQDAEKAVIEKEEKKYIAISELENVYDYEFNYMESSNIATIDSLNKKYVKAYAKKKIKVKQEAKSITKNIDYIKKGDWVVYISEEGKYAKIRTQNGIIGYVEKKALENITTEREDFTQKEEQAQEQNILEYDITKKEITTFEKRENIINLILQEAIKNDKMYVKITYSGTDTPSYERFKIEIVPTLSECGIKVEL